MPSAFLSPDEAGRLVALHRLGVLDSPHEPGFDSLAACAARVSACPGALISLVDARRVWFKARVGFGTAETARERAFCSHAILGDGPLVVPDASRDARFADHPMVLGEPHMCFYAGLPLRIDGAKVGTLAVFDTMPRTLDDAARRALDSLARVAEAMLHARERLCAVELERTRALDFAGASGDWMWELDRELRYCWLSASFGAMTGISSASMLGQPIADSALLDTHGTPIAGPKGLRDLLARHARLSRVVTRKATPRGPLLVSRSALPVFDAQGTFQGYRGTARDVTQQVRAENLAHAKDQLLRGIAAQVPGVIFQLEIQPDGGQRFRYISDAVQQVFGLQVEQVMADPTLPFRMVHRDDHGAVFKGLGAAGDSLQPWRGEYRLVLADGQERWVGSRATPERAEGGSVLWTGFTADIGESKQTELSLRRSEERWELAADAAGIGIAQLQPASAEVRFDARACRNHGLAAAARTLPLADWLALIHEADRAPVQAALQQAFDTHGTLEARYRVPQPDGSLRHLEIVARGSDEPLHASNELIGTCRDVTGQTVNERLRSDKEAAERANRAKSEFLSRVSHELRTPLNGILGFAQLMTLDREHPLADEQRLRLDSLAQAGRHLLALINDVLDLTRIEQDAFALQVDAVDMGAVVERCLALVQPLADASGVKLPQRIARAGCWVLGEARALEQVLVNLLSNAIKYNRVGGEVELNLSSDATWVKLAVRDHGAGLSVGQQQRLFEPFNRLGAESLRIEGSGLGLVIARQLVLAMHGQLQVQSEPQEGSVFSVSLPRADPPSRAVVPQLPAVEPVVAVDGRAHRVLYVEDEPLNVLLMQEVFRLRPQWSLEIAADAEGGLRRARAHPPDLALIDMNLPDESGIWLLARLRADPATAQLVCVALSADAMREQIDAALRAGFDAYWTKPIDVPRVLAQLQQVLARRRETAPPHCVASPESRSVGLGAP